MQRNYSWLEIAEYLSIIASIIGSIAAVATQKAALMAAPMSMSLMLNLLHRKKLLQLSRQKIAREVTEQFQKQKPDVPVRSKDFSLYYPSRVVKPSRVWESLPPKQRSSAIASLPLEQIETCLVHLCQQVEEQQLQISQLTTNLDQLNDQLLSNLATVSGESENLQGQFNRLNATRDHPVQPEISALQIEVDRISEQLSQLHQDPETLLPKKKLKQIISAIKHLHQENLDLRASIAHLNQQVDPPQPPLKRGEMDSSSVWENKSENLSEQNLTIQEKVNVQPQQQLNHCLEQISDLRGSLAELTRAIAWLEKETEQIVPRPELRSLISDLILIQLQESIPPLTPPSKGGIGLSPTMMDQSLSLNGFSSNGGEVKGDNGFHPSSDVDSIPQLDREIKNISEEIATLEAQMENRLAPLEAIDRHAIEEDLSLQAQAIAQLQDQMKKLLKFYQGNNHQPGTMSSKLDRVETLLNQVSTQVSELPPKVEARVLSGNHLENQPTWTCGQSFRGHSEAIFCLDCSQDQHLLATGSADHTLKIWQVSQTRKIETLPTLCQTLTGHHHWVRSIAMSPQRNFIVSGGADRSLKIWPVMGGLNGHQPCGSEPLKTLTSHSLSVRAIAMSPDGHLLASGSADQTIQIWPVDDILSDRANSLLTSQTVLNGHTAPVDTVAFSPDSQLLASGGVDCTIKIWQMNSLQLLCTLTDHADAIAAVTFSPNPEYPLDIPGYLLASGSVDCAIKIWQIHPETGETTVMCTLTGHSEAVTSVKFSPDGHLLASASIDHTIKIWQISPGDGNGVLLCTLTGHQEPVLDLAFWSDRTLVSCSADGEVKIWSCLYN
jgi:WD40 repeat protein